MSESIIILWTIIIAGILLTAARRIKNKDPNAGYGVAGWTVFLIVLWLLEWSASNG